MSDEDFEQKLQALAGALRRPDPTREWKADILARARCEADAISARRMSPPRWLMAGLAACWLSSVVLYCLTPSTPEYAGMDTRAEAPPSPPVDATPSALIAFNRNLSLELP